MPTKLLRLLRSRASGAMIAQMWQAVGTFGLQLLAAWLLGMSGLGLLSLCLSIIFLATAVASGMVGDSLVILDRHDRQIRAGLQFWTIVIAGVSLLIPLVGLSVSGLLTPVEAVLMGLALVAFQIEELIRRVFMATMRFWNLVIIDSSAVLSALAVIGVWAWSGPVTISTFFVALLVGQVIGCVVGVSMLPASERALVSLRGAAIKKVAGFGAWRGVQVSVAPTVLTAMRVIVTVSVGAAALGQIELARLFAAPALLAVQGLGSYLLSTYVRDKDQPVATLRRRGWHAAGAMIAGTIVAGGLLAAFGPALASLLTGSDVAVDRLALVGWIVYVAASALIQPFASLAAARGRPAQVFWCRTIDAVLVVTSLLVLFGVGVSVSWTPFVLAAGLFVGGVLVRRFVLKPLIDAQAGQPTDHVRVSAIHAIR